jgi:hypothetical protein
MSRRALLCAIGNQRTHRPGMGLSIGEAVPIGRLRTLARPRTMHREAQMQDNGDKDLVVTIGKQKVVGIGSFHKSLPHNDYGEVNDAAFPDAFDHLLAATTSVTGAEFQAVPPLPGASAALTNPTAGLVSDGLIDVPSHYRIPPAPTVQSNATAAEMVELYWMALLRDVPFNHVDMPAAISDIGAALGQHGVVGGSSLSLRSGIDIPDSGAFSIGNLFRLGLPGEERGPMLSQFFVRRVPFGTQTIDVRQRPYKAGMNFLTDFKSWLHAQNTGKDADGNAYSTANETKAKYFETSERYISTMRDLARFVNKDALHQAYFNAALLLLSGEASWTPGNPFFHNDQRDAGFGVLGGPHILALVSEVATRALKAVWHQKWQVHLRLRPEAYGGLAHVQKVGASGLGTRAYGLPDWLFQTDAAQRVSAASLAAHGTDGYLLPMAYTPGSPTHPAYGAGHATVAGACVTVLKAYFNLFEVDKQGVILRDKAGQPIPLPFKTLLERDMPYGSKTPMLAYVTGKGPNGWDRFPLSAEETAELTIEGELNKLAHNVAMGRSMGGVHWRTDNARSLVLGEALAARILWDIARNLPRSYLNSNGHQATFTFRTFARRADGNPKIVVIDRNGISVDGKPPISDSEL